MHVYFRFVKMGSQQFCLRWNNHHSNLQSMACESLDNEEFVDATISCEGHSVKVHKLILSACSPLFKSIFAANPNKHPFIVLLSDVCYSDLKAILNFMYNGEINVSQRMFHLSAIEATKVAGHILRAGTAEPVYWLAASGLFTSDKLPRLLKAAERLNVKGLAEVAQEDQSNIGKFPDVNSGRQTDSPQFVANSVNNISNSINKRKKRQRRNSSDVESNLNQPSSKKQDIIPKVSESLKIKSSSPKACDKSDNIPISADSLMSSVQMKNSHNVSPQSTRNGTAQKNQHLPSNVILPSQETLKAESSSPTPEVISSDEILQDSNSNQEYILEPETLMEQAIAKKEIPYFIKTKNSSVIGGLINLLMAISLSSRDNLMNISTGETTQSMELIDARQKGLDALEKTEKSKAKKVDPVKLKTFVEKKKEATSTTADQRATFDKNQNDIQVVNMEMPLDEQPRDPGPSQDSSVIYQDFNCQKGDWLLNTWYRAKRGPKAAWSDEVMQQAVHEVIVKGTPYKEAAALYKIPLPTLYKYASKKYYGAHIPEISPTQAGNSGTNLFKARQPKRNWSDEAMRQALTMITAGGWDIKQTSQTYNIPLRTLYYHLKKVRNDSSSRPVVYQI
ncbi:Protein bric-a-brac 2 [Nymphon striatum]|nr:Protein bric-a-brac 2 [Nymphon striatum]